MFAYNSHFDQVGKTILIAGLLVIAAQIGRYGFADLHAIDNPEMALVFSSGDPRALVASVALSLTGRNALSLPSARDRIVNALSHDPYVPNGFSIYAEVLKNIGDEDNAAIALRIAADLSWHDPLARAFRLRQALLDRDMAAGLEEIDASYRIGRGLGKSEIALLLPHLANDQNRALIADALVTRPPWRENFLKLLIESPAPLVDISALRSLLEDRGSGLSTDEMRSLLIRMVHEGRPLQAYVAWLKWLPHHQRPAGSWLYNGDFHLVPSNVPFDWTIEPLAGSEVKITPLANGNVLNVNFLGPRLQFKHVYQTLALPQGAYRFSGEEAAKNLNHAYGLRWRMACLANDGADLMTTVGLKGDVFWQSFSTDFTVPADCAFQKLVLEMPVKIALDRAISGSVSFRNLKMVRLEDANP